MVDPGKPAIVSFDSGFVCRDQDVTDLSNPRQETHFILLEMPKDDLAALKAGECFRLQEHSNGGASLCTSKKTYGLEFLENSNSQFLGFMKPAPPVATPPKEGNGDQDAADKAKEDATQKDTKQVEGSNENAAPNNAKEGGAAKDAKQGDGTNEKEASGNAKESCETQDAKKVAAPSFQCQLFAHVRGQIFLKDANGDTSRIHELVSKNKLELESAVPRAPPSKDSGMSTASLQYSVAASAAEIKAFLDQGPYAEQAGVWKLLSPGYERQLIDISLSLITANGWDKKAVDGNALLQAVQDHLGDSGKELVPSLDLLKKILRNLCAIPQNAQKEAAKDAKDAQIAATQTDAAAEGKTSEQVAAKTAAMETEVPISEDTISLDVERVHKFQVLQLLHDPPAQVRDRFEFPVPGPRPKRSRLVYAAPAATGKDQPLLLSELVSAVREVSGNDDAVTAEKVLATLGNTVRHDEMQGTVHVLDVNALPMDARERLKALFELQSHWQMDTIVQLVRPVLGSVKADVWVLKNTRQAFVEITPGKEERMLVKKFGGV